MLPLGVMGRDRVGVGVSCAAEVFATVGEGLSALGVRRTMAVCDVGAVAGALAQVG